MTTGPLGRLLSLLPAVYAESDTTGDLERLLATFDALFFDDASHRNGVAVSSPIDPSALPPLPGCERLLSSIPLVLSPTPAAADANGDAPTSAVETQAPDAFVTWLAASLAFTPHVLFDPPALRRVVAGIVPMNGLRGTRGYLLRLLELCFAEELVRVDIDDSPHPGFVIGLASIGRDTQLSSTGPFRFRVFVVARADTGPAARLLERRLHAVIDYAKPAHTAYELHWEH